MSRSQQVSPFLKQLWTVAVSGGMVAIWKVRNRAHFEGRTPTLQYCFNQIRKEIHIAATLSTAHTHNSLQELEITRTWGLSMRPTTAPRVQQGIWLPPAYGQIKINTDGAAKGNPGQAGYGSAFKDQDGNFLLIRGKGLDEATSFWAESIGILESVEIAIEKGWLNVWVESDVATAVSAYTSNSMPWQMKYRWQNCMKRHISFTSLTYGGKGIPWRMP
ncbi:hypothetical protein IFM89_014294 [Coptis chinensis]|uniref:RNase H type-1 domain-containing protein n=1 Tax=Coptis chinensis TaxID=261450 RepID=A0A835HUU4_9MAGN|nr:hypothetical protein IFM89_014294 [Coptis chinensis]